MPNMNEFFAISSADIAPFNFAEIFDLPTFKAPEPPKAPELSQEGLPEGVVRVHERLTMTVPTAGMHDWPKKYFYVAVVTYDPRPELGGGLNFYTLYPRDPASVVLELDYRNREIEGHVVLIPLAHDGDPYDYSRVELELPFHDNPWAKHDWFRANYRRWVEHMPRASEKVSGLIAYFQDATKRARNIRTPIKPGKYLKKFFGDILSQEEIHKYALEWHNHHALREVKVTQDADEIEAVYRGAYNGSCMWFKHGDWDGSCHPARAYAGPDVGIAYIGYQDSADARCLVWPDKKIYYPKWYGDGPRLEAALIAKGYRAGYENDFRRARMQRIPFGAAFVVPYVDVCCYLGDDGDYLTIGGDDVHCRQTNGLSQELYTCEDCDDRVSEGEIRYVAGDRRVCAHCREQDYFYCEIEEEYYPDDERAPTPDDYALSLRGADRAVSRYGNWFFCELTETYYPESRYDYVTLADGRTCLLSYAEEHGYECAYWEEWTLDHSDKLTLSDDRFVNRQNFPTFGELQPWLDQEDVTVVSGLSHDEEAQLSLDLEVAA